MSSQLPNLNSRQVIAALKKVGFAPLSGRGKGSHTFLYRPLPPTGITVPQGDIGRGLLRAIIRQAGLTVEEFLKLL